MHMYRQDLIDVRRLHQAWSQQASPLWQIGMAGSLWQITEAWVAISSGAHGVPK